MTELGTSGGHGGNLSRSAQKWADFSAKDFIRFLAAGVGALNILRQLRCINLAG